MALASLSEIVMLVAVGLTVNVGSLDDDVWLNAVVLALILAFLARPLVVGVLLLPVRLRWGERLFVMWSGLKGAVPILLTTLAILAGAEESQRVYAIVFVVVAFSVLVQGTTIPFVARWLGIPMRTIETEPWDLSIRLRDEPTDVQRYVVGERTRAAGERIRDLPLGEHAWISLLLRDGRATRAAGGVVLEPGDEVVVLCEERDADALRHLFEGTEQARD